MAKEMLCTSCGYQGKPKQFTKGSLGMEIILWILFIIPGFIYSCWRLGSRFRACPYCQSKMIPLDSPVARKFIENFR